MKWKGVDMERQGPPRKMSHVTRLLLTPEEAAESLGIKRAKLYQLIMTKQIFSVKIGALRRLPRQSLEEYVARLCRLEEME